MATIICNVCSVINNCNSTKCECCMSIFSDENSAAIGEWENDFRFIEEAELKGEIYNLESFDGALAKVEVCEGIEQCIKEEPEVQLEPDIVNEDYIETDIEFKEERTDTDGCAKHRCSECSKCFKRKASLKAHFTAVHCESDSGSDRPIIKKIKSQQLSVKPKITVYKCKSCAKITKDYNEHLHHIKSHKNLRKSLASCLSKCTQCQKLFSNSFDLKIHKAQHEGRKVYQCDICNAFLSNEIVLEKHKNRLHSDNKNSNAAGENKFRCEFCDKRFPLQILMVNHKKTHAEDAQLLEDTATISKEGSRISYICKMCGKSSSNKSRHTEHLRVHTKEKPFQCDMCGAAFTARGSLTHHLRLHSDERPFKCNICDVTYRHKKNLRRHLLKHTGERPHKCHYCDKRFALKCTKIDHERQVHTGETPYQCEICELWFTTFALRNVHRRLKHDIDTNSKPRVEILINKISTSDGELSDQEKK